MIAVASPYLTRPMRRLDQLLMLVLAFASLYLGTALPDGALAAVALGWAVAAMVHLVFGSPGDGPRRAGAGGAGRVGRRHRRRAPAGRAAAQRHR